MIAALYREISAVEAQHANARDAAAAGRRALDSKLQEAGASYDEFLWSITKAEAAA